MDQITKCEFNPNNKISGCGVYAMKWNNCPYVYVGQSKNLKTRQATHLFFFKSVARRHSQIKLHETFLKYGFPTFSVLEYCEEGELTATEDKYMAMYKGEFLLNTHAESNSEAVLRGTVITQLTKDEYNYFYSKLKDGANRREALIETLLLFKDRYQNERFWTQKTVYEMPLIKN